MNKNKRRKPTGYRIKISNRERQREGYMKGKLIQTEKSKPKVIK